eukprot:Partr_v1_DN28965_c1_g1_i3_m25575 putative Yip1 domain family
MSRPPGASKSDVVLDMSGADDMDAKLEFQNFNLSTSAVPPAASGKMSSSPHSGGGLPSPPGLDDNHQQQQQQSQKKTFWTVAFYQEYFNVDTDEVQRRITQSIIPTSYFFDVLGGNPDLYGPFWIATTVMAVAFVTNTVNKYIADATSHKEFSYDISKLSQTGTVVYLYITAIPAIVWLVMGYLSFKSRLMDIVCLYGYGMTIWIPMLLLSLIPVTWIHLLLAIVGFAFSVMFTVRNYYPFFGNSTAASALPGGEPLTLSLRTRKLSAGTIVLLLVIASQLAFALVYLFIFV